ncbi:MAG TPA: DsrE family protein [Acidobacteriota bacterium]|nr:DsrE family protein [Acidobacteriota bacterium]
MKTAIIILSDPENGEDALGRAFNGLAAAYDFQQKGEEVTILFQGAATRWPGRLSQPDHPAHALYQAVADRIAGISCACADVFGGAEEAEKNGLDLITGNPVPGTSGLPSLQKLTADGFNILTF